MIRPVWILSANYTSEDAMKVFAALATVVSVLFGVPTWSSAQDYPSRPIKIIVPTPPGGLADLLARVVAQKLQENTGATLVVENRTGASGQVAAQFVAKSPPDGYTVFIGYHATQSMLQHLVAKLGYDPDKDFVPVIYLALAPNVLIVNPSVPARSVQELVAYAKANPGKLTFASQGIGTTGHLGGEQFKQSAGIDISHVPYRGAAPALQDLIGGQVSMMFDVVPLSKEHIASGKVRALAVATKQRVPTLPDVPTMAEAGLPDVEAGAWWGLLFPAGTPPQMVEWLNREAKRALSAPDVRTNLEGQGMTLYLGTPAEFAEHIAAETKRWGEVIRKGGIKQE
jgi:tripartite-type tricarboxylate transporter receptor subunit TctC